MAARLDPHTTESLAARETARLWLVRWGEEHAERFAELNADPEVMRYINAGIPLSRAESDEISDRVAAHWDAFGFGLWAAIVKATGTMSGFVGICHPLWHPEYADRVEVGWRLRREAWGHGYATEGACAALAAGFGELGVEESVAFVHPDNEPSKALSARLGMTCDRRVDHPQRDHGLLLYSLRAT